MSGVETRIRQEKTVTKCTVHWLWLSNQPSTWIEMEMLREVQ